MLVVLADEAGWLYVLLCRYVTTVLRIKAIPLVFFYLDASTYVLPSPRFGVVPTNLVAVQYGSYSQ